MILFTVKPSCRSGRCTEPSPHLKWTVCTCVIKCDYYKGRVKMYMAPDSAKSFILYNFLTQQKSTDEWQLFFPAANIVVDVSSPGSLFRGKVQLADFSSFGFHKSHTWLIFMRPSQVKK